MELEINQSKLNKILSVVSRVAGGGIGAPMLPILSNVLIRVKGQEAAFVTTNLEMAIVEKVQVKNSKDGEITVPAKLLADFISNLPKDETIKMGVKGQKINITAGRYSSVLNGIGTSDFPELPEIEEEKAVIFRIGAEEFKKAVAEVAVACSTNTVRPIFTGVYFNTYDSDLYMAATDGYRLTEKKFIKGVESEVKIIVPATSLQEVVRSIDEEVEEIEMLFDETQVRFRLGGVEITSRLIDGSYVDYKGLIPKETKIKMEIKRNELVRVTKLAALFARASGGSIRCETKKEKGVLSVAAVANEFGENDSEIETSVNENGVIILNSKYLLDALGVMNDEVVKIGFSEKMAPLVLRNKNKEDYVHIIMPQHQ